MTREEPESFKQVFVQVSGLALLTGGFLYGWNKKAKEPIDPFPKISIEKRSVQYKRWEVFCGLNKQLKPSQAATKALGIATLMTVTGIAGVIGLAGTVTGIHSPAELAQILQPYGGRFRSRVHQAFGITPIFDDNASDEEDLEYLASVLTESINTQDTTSKDQQHN